MTEYDEIGRFLKDIGKLPLLTAEEERDLSERIHAGDEAARHLLILSNLRLCVTVAGDYVNRGLDLQDLVAEVVTGLMDAATRFDGTLGVRFSSFAGWWLQQRAKRALSQQTRVVRLPLYVVERIHLLRVAADAMEDETGREVTGAELAEELGISPQNVERYKTAALQAQSLDAPINPEESDDEFGDFVEDVSSIRPDEACEASDLREALLECMGVLSERERSIVVARFNLNGEGRRTLRTIGKQHQVSHERARQLVVQTLEKLRSAMLRAESGHNGNNGS